MRTVILIVTFAQTEDDPGRSRCAAVQRVPALPDTLATVGAEVDAYRAGYADGYVDCATVRSMVRPPR